MLKPLANLVVSQLYAGVNSVYSMFLLTAPQQFSSASVRRTATPRIQFERSSYQLSRRCFFASGVALHEPTDVNGLDKCRYFRSHFCQKTRSRFESSSSRR
ncbi:hypothetical protein HDV62DRAFT_78334 [Trichoderma sp. SZMC 28011]